MRTQNGILADIVVASGGTVTLPATRNSLLGDWLLAAGGGDNKPLRTGKLLKIIAAGDSITAQGNTTRTAALAYSSFIRGYWVGANMYSNNQYYVVDSIAVGGSTTIDVLARVPSIIATGAGICLVMAGTNDLSAARTPAQIEVTMLQIVDDLTAAGLAVVIVPVTRREISQGFNTNINTLNALYSGIASGNDNCVYLDCNSGFNSFIDGGNPLTVTTDGLHPNDYGGYLIGKELAPKLDKVFDSFTDEPSIFTNSDLNGTGGTLVSGATGVVPDGLQGYWCDYQIVTEDSVNKISVTTGTTGTTNQSLVRIRNTPVIDTDVYRAVATIELTNNLNILNSLFFFEIKGNGGEKTSVFINLTIPVDPSNTIGFNSVEFKTPPMSLKAGTTLCDLFLRLYTDSAVVINYKVSNIRIEKVI